jgi:predicted Zn-dependent peptidase
MVMTAQTIHTETLENGLTLVVEPMPAVQSAAFSLMVPAGSIYDPPGSNGSAALLCDLITRGAGDRDSKQLSAALDNLGLQRHESVTCAHLAFGGAALADHLPAALQIYGSIVLEPRLPQDEFEAARAAVEQSLRTLEDEPRQKVIVELRRSCYDAPWGLPSDGTLEDVANLTADSVREHYARCFRPDETILGIAGNVDMAEIRDVVQNVFSAWKPQPAPTYRTSPRGPAQVHLPHESTQTHIGIAYESVPYRDPDYFAAWAAVSVLSGGMSARLFTEIREKRGLCYAVHASLNSLRDEARVLCYAGTTAERARETLEVTLGELKRLGDGIADDELTRCQARAKSALVMQQESTISRSSAIARDWHHLGRVMTLEEVRNRIDALTVETVLEYIKEHPARDFTILTIGPEPPETASDVP